MKEVLILHRLAQLVERIHVLEHEVESLAAMVETIAKVQFEQVERLTREKTR